MVASRNSLLLLAVFSQYAAIGAEAQAQGHGQKLHHDRSQRQGQPSQYTSIPSPIARLDKPASTSPLSPSQTTTPSTEVATPEADLVAHHSSNVKAVVQGDAGLKDLHNDGVAVNDDAGVITYSRTIGISFSTVGVAAQNMPPMDKGQVDEPTETAPSTVAATPTFFGVYPVSDTDNDGQQPATSKEANSIGIAYAYHPVAVWGTHSPSSTEGTEGDVRTVPSPVSSASSSSLLAPSPPVAPHTTAATPGATPSLGSNSISTTTGISNSSAEAVPMSPSPRYSNTSSLPSLTSPSPSPSTSPGFFNNSQSIATDTRVWRAQIPGNVTYIVAVPTVLSCRASICNGIAVAADVSNCTSDDDPGAKNGTMNADGLSANSHPARKQIIVTTTITSSTITVTTITYTSTVTCPYSDIVSCRILAQSLSSLYVNSESVTVAIAAHASTITGMTTVTKKGGLSALLRRPAYVSATATATAAPSKTQLPLGSTMVNGTFNTCLLPPGAVSTIVHCWGPGARPSQFTCYEQPITESGDETEIAEIITACTVIITMKGPTVVMPTSTLPGYDFPGVSADPHPPIRSSLFSHFASIGEPVDTAYPSGTWNGVTTVPIAILPSGVVIASSTITDLPDATGDWQQTVTIDSVVYTINPSQIFGLGTWINRPALPRGHGLGYGYDGINGNNIVYAAAPTSALLSGLSVQISGDSVQVDGTAFSIPAQPSVAVVRGTQTVYLGPDGVVAGGETLSMSPVVVSAGGGGNNGNGAAAGGSRQGGGGGSEVVVAGGTVLTLDDTNVVVDGHSIAYNAAIGALSTSTVLTVAGDVITIVPAASNGGGSGGAGHGGAFVVIHGTTMTAPAAGSTHYELVGGATFTEVSPSVIVLDGHSYTVGPATAADVAAAVAAAAAATPTTVIVGGETVAIGPGGVTVGGSLTFRYPFVATPTITITGKATLAEASGTRPGAVGGLQSGATPTPTSVSSGNPTDIGSADSNNGGPVPGPKNAAARPVLSVAAFGVSLVISLAAAMSSLIYFG